MEVFSTWVLGVGDMTQELGAVHATFLSREKTKFSDFFSNCQELVFKKILLSIGEVLQCSVLHIPTVHAGAKHLKPP